MDKTKVIFIRRTTNEIENLPIIDGQLIYDVETGDTYIDIGRERKSTNNLGDGDKLPIIKPEDEGKVLTAKDGKPVWAFGGREPGTFNIAYNLIKVNSSNYTNSVKEGASYTATLSPSVGYTLGEITVAMGGVTITEQVVEGNVINIPSVTGDVVIACTGIADSTETPITAKWVTGNTSQGVFTPDVYYLKKVAVDPAIDSKTLSIKAVFPESPTHFTPESAADKTLGARFLLYNDSEAKQYAGDWNPTTNEIVQDGDTVILTQGTPYYIPAGYYVRILLRVEDISVSTHAFFASNAKLKEYANTLVKLYFVSSIPVVPPVERDEPTVMMASFDRVYIDTGIYNKNLKPKWDGSFSLHRGFSTAPENSLQAIWEAKKHGYNCCELDVRLTSDNQPVLSHSATVTGTVNGVETTYTIANTTLNDIVKLDIGGSKYPGLTVPSLATALEFCRRIGMRAELDYKLDKAELYTKCVELTKSYGMQDDTLHCCYSIDYAISVKTVYPKANVRVSIKTLPGDSRLDDYIAKPGNIYAWCDASECGAGENLTRIPAVKQRGYKLYVWGVNPNNLPDVMQWNPDILQPQSVRDGEDWYELIRGLDAFQGVIW